MKGIIWQQVSVKCDRDSCLKGIFYACQKATGKCQGIPKKKAQGQDLALDPLKQAFFSIEINSVLMPLNFWIFVLTRRLPEGPASPNTHQLYLKPPFSLDERNYLTAGVG